MGILNVTPDSFSDGGQFYSASDLRVDQALKHAEAMVSAGATLVDIGGESTRPGAAAVSTQEELDRVIPVVEKIAASLDVVISVDTSTPEVMTASAAAGAGLINDVRALARDGALAAAASTGLPICLMHMQGAPQTMQDNPHYQDVVEEVEGFLAAQIARCEAAGISREQLLLDPGFGFGKTLEHNLTLLNQMERLHHWGLPLLVGTSRKTMIGQVLNKPVDERLFGSVATAVMAVMKGAWIVRVHDVAETVDAIRMTWAVMQEKVEDNV
ncbi:dihydropteroate synthase [Neptuniibacter sp. CAU 1671]|uniref:dihydropteroate synthase n=1 Tax=Neptuniibacter sp. CAU 1671 TaxID=3032593 RepID=UPI0023D9A505|nr:dihydropteroate synthase [Neptuniibacter sp. CAU 1671]MDF2181201.1 dihydropteroate synthase [Neptuniibacter sp. CAU 1671]